jgi:HD-like signal output (HDOD) protein
MLQQIESRIVELIASDRVKVPPYPAVASRLSQLISTPDFDLRDVVKLLSSDQALAAAMLRYANSAVFPASRPVVSLHAAVSRIGSSDLIKLVYASSLGLHADAPGPLSELRRVAWRQALVSALVCQQLAPRRRLETGEAFVCGLLHDFGRVVAISCLERLVAEGQHDQPCSYEEWFEVVERFHIELGMVMAAKWNLPPVIVEAISAHHQPAPGTIVELVALSDRIVDYLEQVTHVAPAALDRIPQLGDRDERAFIAELLPRLPSIVAAFTDLPVFFPPATPTPRPTPVPSLVERRASTLRAPLHPLAARVVCQRVGAPLELEELAIAKNGLAARATEALPVNRLVNLALEVEGAPEPLSIWAKVSACQPDGDRHRLELQPFALRGELQAQWDALFLAASAARR